jgi:hypothetical protein
MDLPKHMYKFAKKIFTKAKADKKDQFIKEFTRK